MVYNYAHYEDEDIQSQMVVRLSGGRFCRKILLFKETLIKTYSEGRKDNMRGRRHAGMNGTVMCHMVTEFITMPL